MDDTRKKKEQAEIFEEKMNDWIAIIDERTADNNQELTKLIAKLFGEGGKAEEEESVDLPVGFAGVAGIWLNALRNINSMLIYNGKTIRRINREFK